MDTVNEFPSAPDWPESGQDESPGQAKSRGPGGPDEFADSIKSAGEPTQL